MSAVRRRNGATDHPMGTSTYPITLHAASGDETEVLEARVDTGAAFTSIPSSVLEKLGFARHRVVRLRPANGNLEERSLGRVMVELEGEREEIHCVFGGPDGPPAIGAHTLKGCLLTVDPVQQRLVPVEGYWL